MRTSFVKMILPMAVITVAIAGALTTSAMGKNSASSPVQGYSHLEDEPCHKEIMCNNAGGVACTVGAVQLYAKSGATCPTPLFRSN
ncbi:DUF6520 family protein [Flavobacterium sp. XS2P39]|uniref:DUF6520 family protein n=1 Tax=Flavobacterium sp. XS2P39 TaxID=3401725 RepID=UPI003AABCD24